MAEPELAELQPLDLYERCVQSPDELVGMLHAIHGGGGGGGGGKGGAREPLKLAEDFCGSGATSVAWIKAGLEMQLKRQAVACDLDAAAIVRLKRTAKAAGAGVAGAIKAVQRDVVLGRPGMDRATAAADVVFVGNFSIGYIHQRPLLVKYLKRCRTRLNKGGVVVVDTYGGATSYTPGALKRKFKLADGRTIHYTWQQLAANPLTAMVENRLHFRVEYKGEIVQDVPDAFIYHWRLWSVPELREAMAEAGLRRIEVYDQVPDAQDGDGLMLMQPVDGTEMDESFAVLVAGRK